MRKRKQRTTDAAIARLLPDHELKRLMRTRNAALRDAADDELAARRREQQDDTPCIEWNGWNHPGDY